MQREPIETLKRSGDVVALRPGRQFQNAITKDGRIESWLSRKLEGTGSHFKMLDELKRMRGVADAVIQQYYGVILKEDGTVEFAGRVSEEDREKLEKVRDAVRIAFYHHAPRRGGLVLRVSGEVTPWGWNRGIFPDGDPLPGNLPKDIDEIRVGFGSGGDSTVGAVHSVSRGWIFFGNDIDTKAAARHAAGCIDVQFIRHKIWGMRPIGAKPAESKEKQMSTQETTEPVVPGSGRTIRVSPEGLGDTVTLDAALDGLETGDTLWLAPGNYPKSAHPNRPEIGPAGSYAVLKSGVMIRGHQSIIPTMIRIPGANVTVDGVKVNKLDGYRSSSLSVMNSLIEILYAPAADRFSLANSVVSESMNLRISPVVEIDGLTLRVRSRCNVERADLGVRNSILSGGAAYLFETTADLERFDLLDTLISPSGAFTTIRSKSGPDQKAHIEKSEDFEPNGIKATGCLFEKVVFRDPVNGDFRLAPGSPGKGAGPGGRDLGANLDADGWPIPRE
jgi:hypothetical protein